MVRECWPAIQVERKNDEFEFLSISVGIENKNSDVIYFKRGLEAKANNVHTFKKLVYICVFKRCVSLFSQSYFNSVNFYNFFSRKLQGKNLEIKQCVHEKVKCGLSQHDFMKQICRLEIGSFILQISWCRIFITVRNDTLVTPPRW